MKFYEHDSGYVNFSIIKYDRAVQGEARDLYLEQGESYRYTTHTAPSLANLEDSWKIFEVQG